MRVIPCLVLLFMMGCAANGKEEVPAAVQNALAIEQKRMISGG